MFLRNIFNYRDSNPRSTAFELGYPLGYNASDWTICIFDITKIKQKQTLVTGVKLL